MTLTVSGGFLDKDLWTRIYQRNNKRSGLKNIRCFPFCGDVHLNRGFCGRAVTVYVEIHKGDVKPSGQHLTTFGHTLKNVNDDKSVPYLSWGEFRRLDDENVPSLPLLKKKKPSKHPDLKIEVGTTITATQAFSRSRTRDDAARPWYPGDAFQQPSEDGSLRIAFVYNLNKRGWNYGWAACKHTCNSQHVFRSYVFQIVDSKVYKCIATFDSPSFTLFSRRRENRLALRDLPQQIKHQLITERKARSGNEGTRSRRDEVRVKTQPGKRAPSCMLMHEAKRVRRILHPEVQCNVKTKIKVEPLGKHTSCDDFLYFVNTVR